MRLLSNQIETIKQLAKENFGTNTSVWLFGSRVDDNKRGRDIDLLIRPQHFEEAVVFMAKVRFLTQLQAVLGEQKIDLVIENPNDDRPIVQIALRTGVAL